MGWLIFGVEREVDRSIPLVVSLFLLSAGQHLQRANRRREEITSAGRDHAIGWRNQLVSGSR